ncbi:MULTISPECIES: helix-turn-helix transcriptional regulator [unclassified Serratia (in: enterobacteria)]|uniref:XRE family transcriptional regulator n=1 Tax=unclassified Serratia (in: enterobacteria) TaxID=2647522 RepID=UPI00046A3D22|nr:MULTISPECIES: helix-turn-helix transcriptional regulator [unclassified Serratia (in: enterobacteria)]
MKTTLSERLSIAMELRGISQGMLAERVGVSQPSIWKLVSGRTHSSRKLVEIARELNVRPEWLARGEEPMWEDVSPSGSKVSVSVITNENHSVHSGDEIMVPLLSDIDFISIDGDFYVEGQDIQTLTFTKKLLQRAGAEIDGSGVLCFPISGDGMEPAMPDGSILAINTGDKKVVDGKIYAINQNGWKRVKILYRTGPDALSLRSFNKDEHPDEAVSLQDVEIIGRVFWWAVTC